ncbi:hypothetical protein BKA82DRAFT_918362 [Pisolithus tinctorius]|uniref:Uncharacterized protein n=1 Tax=Pisolithus tinctorius Marx 270 TaxID=870435 RepID=A0A0C3IJI2_PISTI|nr:hypothetical protein BKA82DRAFT_918362 [Pisolithus tinctorius]KIN97147.1 hypothetical protein M404DRAFT_918362 [Pisolithus tinctorius Marx 270]
MSLPDPPVAFSSAERNGDSTSELITLWIGAIIAPVSFTCTLYILVHVISERILSTSSAPIFILPRIQPSPSCRMVELTHISFITGVVSRSPGLSDGGADTHKLHHRRRAFSPVRSESITSSARMRNTMDALACLEGREDRDCRAVCVEMDMDAERITS